MGMRQGTLAFIRLNAPLYDKDGNIFRATSERPPEEKVIVWKDLVMLPVGVLATEVVLDLDYFDRLALSGFIPPRTAYIASGDLRAETKEEAKAAKEAARAKERAGKEALALTKKAPHPFITDTLSLPLPPKGPS